jgi:N-acetylglucosaminyl-diphospho-decaprenol L-rhamnosyltransferase
MNISFVVIEYHCLEEIRLCLAALRSHIGKLAVEIFISSNSEYPMEAQAQIKKDFPKTRWLFNEKNGGFAYAMNRGIEKTSGDVVVLLNPDARLLSAIEPAYRFLLARPEIAVLGPRILNHKGEIQDSARCFMTPWVLAKRSLTRLLQKCETLLEKNFNYYLAQPVDWVIGAFMMIKKNAIEKAGLLDEKYFLYVEDMDWSKRFWDSGFMVYYFPDLAVAYEGSRRSIAFLLGNKDPNRYAFLHLRSYFRFVCKHRYFYRRSHSAII